jgi:hypothetical protein
MLSHVCLCEIKDLSNWDYQCQNKIKEEKKIITLTFGDMAENHKGMQQIGQLVKQGNGFNLKDLHIMKNLIEEKKYKCELVSLSIKSEMPDAYILIIRDGVNMLLNNKYTKEDLMNEQLNLDYDKKAFMYGRVVNKSARWNLCFDENSQEPDYAEGKGRIISFSEIPITDKLYKSFSIFGEKAVGLKGEANYYYDINKTGIGFHGDSERRKVIGVRLGDSMPLYYQWYKDGVKVDDKIEIKLNGGDIYIMSEKAVGTDWKKKKIFTLRHATGCSKYTNAK